MCSQTRNSCAKAFDNRSRSINLKPKNSRGGQFDTPPPPPLKASRVNTIDTEIISENLATYQLVFSHSSEDIAACQDSVLKELEKKHRLEREFLMSLVQEEGSVDLREEARGMPEDERLKAIQELKDKRDELDFGVKGLDWIGCKVSNLYMCVCVRSYCS